MRVLKEIATLVVLVVLIVLPIRIFIAQPFVVDGESMFPTFHDRDYLIVDELTYRFNDPKRGDVVVFRYPENPALFFIKRIIGLPGETVVIDHGKVQITRADKSTVTFDEPYVVNEDATYTLDATLGNEQYFVMGDNRPKSLDSRVWGPLSKEDIMGRAYLRLMPLGDAGFMPGAVELPQ